MCMSVPVVFGVGGNPSIHWGSRLEVEYGYCEHPSDTANSKVLFWTAVLEFRLFLSFRPLMPLDTVLTLQMDWTKWYGW